MRQCTVIYSVLRVCSVCASSVLRVCCVRAPYGRRWLKRANEVLTTETHRQMSLGRRSWKQTVARMLICSPRAKSIHRECNRTSNLFANIIFKNQAAAGDVVPALPTKADGRGGYRTSFVCRTSHPLRLAWYINKLFVTMFDV